MTTPLLTEEQERTSSFDETVRPSDTTTATVAKRRETWKILAAAAAGLVVVLLLSYLFLGGSGTATPSDGTATVPGEPAAPVPISTAVATMGEVPSYLEVTGTLLAYETTDVAPQSPGQVVATPIDEGTFVRRGQVVVRLNDRDARLRIDQAEASVAQARANLEQARASLGVSGTNQIDPTRVAEVEQARAQMVLAETNERRYRSLVETGDVSQAQYDEYRARADTARKQYEAALAKAKSGGAGIDVAAGAVEAAQAQLALARKTLADMTITAPFDGYVVHRPAAVGEWVTTSTPVVRMVQIGLLKLQLQVAEADAARARLGMPVKLRVDAYPDREFMGVVAAIIPSLDTASRSLNVIAGVRNEDGQLKPGMFVTARILEDSGTTRSVLVPAAAVVKAPTGAPVVYVVENNRATARVVQVGQTVGAMVQILDGVAEGEQVATDGVDRLTDGATVIPTAS